MRRDRVDTQMKRMLRDWSADLANLLDFDKLIDVAKTAMGPIEATKTQERRIRQAILAFLLGTIQTHKQLEEALHAIIADRRAEGKTEGGISATALSAEYHAQEPPNLFDLHATAIKQVKSQDGYSSGLPAIATKMLGGLAGDLADRLGAGITDNQSDSQLASGAKTATLVGAGLLFYLGDVVHRSYTSAQTQVYLSQGMGSVDYLTVGDDRVCPTCLSYEAESPWPVNSVPTPPVHGGCRCWLVPSG